MLALAARIVALICVCVVSSCSADSSTVDAPSTGPTYTPVTPVTCTEGKACECMPGQPGTVSCAGGFSSCECAECPPLDVHDAAKIDACGGAPFGVWRLTKLEVGRGQLELSVAGQSRGSCDFMLDTPGKIPRVLMNLKDGGVAEYDAEIVATQAHWSDGCVTSKAGQLSCGSTAWTGVSNCALSCDICSCDTTLGSTAAANGGWLRTASTLTVAPFGTSGEFDYCAQGSKLTLSRPDLSLEFEQVFTLDTPTACDKRSPVQCTLGQGCSLGVCEGAGPCAQSGSEAACLTKQGCTWDATACTGLPRSCTLADFGTVPGCDFVDHATSCIGTPTACTTLDVDTCVDRPGCKLNDGGRCSGPSLPCKDFFACPIGYCSFNSPDCNGLSSCAAFKDHSQCDDANDNFPNAPCTWEQSWCEGDAEPCSSYAQSACGSVPGCELGTP
ncbi:MAG: hypothetical protein ABUL62_12795 [Myxococcales bacterium]|jgi:hypothetical protein